MEGISMQLLTNTILIFTSIYVYFIVNEELKTQQTEFRKYEFIIIELISLRNKSEIYIHIVVTNYVLLN